METDDPITEDVIPSPQPEKVKSLNENGDIRDHAENIPSPLSKPVTALHDKLLANDVGNHSEPEEDDKQCIAVKENVQSNDTSAVGNDIYCPKETKKQEKEHAGEEAEKVDETEAIVVNTRPKRVRKKKKHPDSPDSEDKEIKVTKSESPKQAKKKRKLTEESDAGKDTKEDAEAVDTGSDPPKAKRAKKSIKEKPSKIANKTNKIEKKNENEAPKSKRKYSRKPKVKEPTLEDHQMNGELSSNDQDVNEEVKSPKPKKPKKSPMKAVKKEPEKKKTVSEKKSPEKAKASKGKEKLKNTPEKSPKKSKTAKKPEDSKPSSNAHTSGKESASKKKESQVKDEPVSTVKDSLEESEEKKSKKKPSKTKKAKKVPQTPQKTKAENDGDAENSGEKENDKSSLKEESPPGDSAGHSKPSKEENIEEEREEEGQNDEESEDDKPFNCPECKYRAKKKGQLRKHLAVHNIFQCAHCDFTATVRENIEEHMRVNHPTRCGRKLCKKCNVLFRLDEIEEHDKQCTGEKKPWVCCECKKEFKFYCAMKTHHERWHTGKCLPKYSCEECEFEAANKIALKRHIKETHKVLLEKTVKCSECDTMFRTASEMNKHRKKTHEKKKVKDKPAPTSFPCEKCDQSYASESGLRNHVVNVHDQPAATILSCEVNDCSETCKSKSELAQHKKSVHNIDPPKFKCTFAHCDLEFLKGSHLKRHEVTHTGERKYRCDWPDCGKAFRHADNLRVHYRRHTNEKPLKCDLCGASYRQKNGLKYHMEKAHGTTCPPAKKTTSNSPTKTPKKEGASPKKKKEEEVAKSPGPKVEPLKTEQKAPDSSDSQSSAKDVYEFHDSDDEGLDLKMLPKTPLKSAGSPRLRPDCENKPFPTPFPEVPSPIKKVEDTEAKGKKKKTTAKKTETKGAQETEEPKEKKEKKSKSKKAEKPKSLKKEKEEVMENKPKPKAKKKKKKEDPIEEPAPVEEKEEIVEEPPLPSPVPESVEKAASPPPQEEEPLKEVPTPDQDTTEEYQDTEKNDAESGAGSIYDGENYEDQCDQWVNAPAPPQVNQDSDMEEEPVMEEAPQDEEPKEAMEVSGMSDSLNMSDVAQGGTPGPEDISQQYQDVQNRLDSGEEAYTEEIAKAARDLLGETSDHQSDVPDNVDLNPASREVPVIQSPPNSCHADMAQPASVASSYGDLPPDMNNSKYSMPPPPAYGYGDQPSYPSEMQPPPEKVPETLDSPASSEASKYTYPGDGSYSNPTYSTSERGATMSMDTTATTTYSGSYPPSSEVSYSGTMPPTTTSASYSTATGTFMETPLYLTSRPTDLPSVSTRSLPPTAASFGTDAFSSRDFFGQYFQDPGTLPLTHPPLSQDQRLSYHAAAQQSSLSALQRSNADLLRRAATGSLMPPGSSYPSVTESLVGMNPSLAQTSQQAWMVPHDDRSRSHWGQPSPIITAPEIDSTSPLSRNPYSCERPDYASFDPNASSQLNKRSESTFPPVPQTVATPPEARYDMASYMGSRSLPGSGNYGRSMPSASSSKQLEDVYRHAAHITDYTRSLPQAPPPMADMYSRMGMNPAAPLGLDKYYYPSRDMYRSQHTLSGSAHPFIPPTSSSAPTAYSDRDYGRSAMYPQHAGAYSFMGDKQYLGATNKVPQGVAAPGHLPTDYLQHATPGAADPHMQDPYRRSVIYNMMPRYF